MAAPISVSAGACSKTLAVIPRSRSASPRDSPPIPAPITTTRSSEAPMIRVSGLSSTARAGRTPSACSGGKSAQPLGEAVIRRWAGSARPTCRSGWRAAALEPSDAALHGVALLVGLIRPTRNVRTRRDRRCSRGRPAAYGVGVVTLAEDLYLLALDETGGRLLIDPLRLDLGLGGALLLDLAVRKRVALLDEHVAVNGEGTTGEPLLGAALSAIAEPTRAHGPDHWVRHLGRGAHHTVQEHLVGLGVLEREDGRVLRFIPVHRTRETDGRLHHELIDH